MGSARPLLILGPPKTAVVPAPVRGLTVTANGQDKLDLSWPLISAANDGGAAIVGYLIQVADDIRQRRHPQGEPCLVPDVNPTTVSGATFTDGAGGGSYTYSEST